MSFSNIASKQRQREVNDYERKVQQNNRTPGSLLQFEMSADAASKEEVSPKAGMDANTQTALRRLQGFNRELAKEISTLASNPSEVKHMLTFEDRKGQSRSLISNVQKALDSWQPDPSNPVQRFGKDKASDAFAEEKKLCMRRLEEFQDALATAKDKLEAKAAGSKPQPSYGNMDDLIDLGHTSKFNGDPDDLIELCGPGEDRTTADSRIIQAQIQRENTERIEGIARQAGEVKAVFKELASVVQDQQQMLETIEGAAESVERSTSAANDELKKTAARQGRGAQMARWAFIISLCLLGLVLWYEGKPKPVSNPQDGSKVVRHVADTAIASLTQDRPSSIEVVHGGKLPVATPPGQSEVMIHNEERFHCTETKDPRGNSLGTRPKSYRCRPEF